MTQLLMLGADLVAIAVLVLGLYFRRHRRRDLVVAYLTVNVGVLAVSLVLADATVGAGLGLGLFGVLSIIRLRSDEIAQHEVAYYFAALALGLVAGLGAGSPAIAIGLIALLLVVMAVGDHPGLFARYRRQVIHLDAAHPDERELRTVLEAMLGARVHGMTVERLDLVDQTTTVDVRYELLPDAARPLLVDAPGAVVLEPAR